MDLALKNQDFIKNVTSNSQNSEKAINQTTTIILSKSLILLSYIIYSANDKEIMLIFKSQLADDQEKNVISIFSLVFNLFSNIIINFNDIKTKYKVFESLGYLWIRFPFLLTKSNGIITSIFMNARTENEKIIILKTFINLFTMIGTIIKQNKENDKKMLNNEHKKDKIFYDEINEKSDYKFDFGVIHLFFENFFSFLMDFLIDSTSPMIRIQSASIIELIFELGNLNVNKVLIIWFTNFSTLDNCSFHCSNVRLFT